MTPAEPDDRSSFRDAEEGGITILSLFLFMAMLMAAGFAVDVNNMVQARAQLQGAADSAAHAALYWRWRHSEDEAKAKAIEVAGMNMPTARYGTVLAASDIEFGDWNPATRIFTPDPGNRTAVRVTTRRTEANDNGLVTFLMKFVGQSVLDVNTFSVWDNEEGWCPNGEGFFAMGVVDIQSNNRYADGFCIHSEAHVEFQQNNAFESGVKVTMPNEGDIVVPSGGLDSDRNPGLAEALDSLNVNLDSFFNDLPSLIDRYRDPYSDLNTWLNDFNIHTSTIKNNLTADDIVVGAVNVLGCKGKTLTIDNDVVIRNAVIITDCEVKFNSGAAIENATLITTDTGTKSISAPSGFRVGASDFCFDGQGGATLITQGDISVASGFEAYGANVIAGGDISITANANGLSGINLMARGRIDATSNGDMGFCGYDPPKPFQIPVFRMVL